MKKRTMNELRKEKEYGYKQPLKKEDRFVKDLVNSRLDKIAHKITENIQMELFDWINEEMIENDLVIFDQHEDIADETNERFDKIYKQVLCNLLTKQLKI